MTVCIQPVFSLFIDEESWSVIDDSAADLMFLICEK